jgi:putative redox protein
MSKPPSIIPFVIQAEGSGVAQTIVASGSAGHTFDADAFPAFGGKDLAPSPLFYVLGSLSSCNQVTASLVAKDLGIRLGAWKFEVQGDLDPSVLATGAEGNANFVSVVVRASVETDASEEQFARLISETERRCPVSQLFKRSGLRFENRWTRSALGLAQAS